MKIILDEELRPLIERVVTETLNRLDAERVKLSGRLAYPEAEAAALIGVERHARLRGEIEASRVGKRIVYTHDELLRFLRTQRT